MSIRWQPFPRILVDSHGDRDPGSCFTSLTPCDALLPLSVAVRALIADLHPGFLSPQIYDTLVWLLANEVLSLLPKLQLVKWKKKYCVCMSNYLIKQSLENPVKKQINSRVT